MTPHRDRESSPQASYPQPPAPLNGYGAWNNLKHWHHDQRLADLSARMEAAERRLLINMVTRLMTDHWQKLLWAGAFLVFQRIVTGSWAGAAAALEQFLTGSSIPP